MTDKMFGIDKGIVRVFAVILVIVGLVLAIFVSQYVSVIMFGSALYAAVNGTAYTYTGVTGEQIAIYNATTKSANFTNNNILASTLKIYNLTNNIVIPSTNYTVDVTLGNITIKDATLNGTTVGANYTYQSESGGKLPLSSDASTLLGSIEDDAVTTYGYINGAVKYGGALITVAAVIILFISFLPNKKEKNSMDY